jgi:hypothetical protein
VDFENRVIRRGVAELFLGKRYFLTSMPGEHGPVDMKMTIERHPDSLATPPPPVSQPEQSEPPRAGAG